MLKQTQLVSDIVSFNCSYKLTYYTYT